MKIKYLLLICFFSVICNAQSVKSFKQLSDRLDITLTDGTLSILPLSESAVRIKFNKVDEPQIPELIFISKNSVPTFKVDESSSKIQLKSGKILVKVDKQTGSISYTDNNGKIFLSENPGSRTLKSSTVFNEPCYITEQSFESASDELILGLGQFQDGHFNLKNVNRRLTQVNSQIAIPFIYSSKGYGLLWHQYGITDFNPADNFVELEKQSYESENEVAEVTTTAGTQKVKQSQSLYKGKLVIPSDGVYSIFLDLGDMDNRQYVLIDDKPCIDFSNFWLPPTVSGFAELKAGEHDIQVVCKSTNIPKISWRSNNDITTFRSAEAKQLDYVVFYGPSADSVIHSYRSLSGNVPMLPKWAFGFWQCRERYSSSEELINTVREFRKRKLPLDVIVQDWQYWGDRGWGVPQLDSKRYPDPAGLINELHDLNAHFNISIWSNPDKNSDIGKEYVSKNLFIKDTKWLDYFNPTTGKMYWKTLKENLFDYGVDSWWMDATEPENDALKGERTAMGLGNFYRLTYPLFVSQSVYEGQRATISDKRVCILTRSAFSGQQRYGIINWSGDIGGTWEGYKTQIAAGLNFTITGFPYWTTDIGGFFRPGKSQYTDENFRELLTRWFQWGVFNPIFRIHGYMSETEPWKFGSDVENNLKEMLNLRYRLLPYIYSEAWKITNNGSTMMRPLVMDFLNDSIAIHQSDEYMFGKSFLVAPITEAKSIERKVYLPETANWFEFWTGELFDGGQSINANAPIDKIPVFVKAGSIIPMGPKIQYAEEKYDPIEIRIYPGADASFTLYEDENDNYNYEKGKYALIKFKWDDTHKLLMISEREGGFDGMMNDREFNCFIVSKGKGIGIDSDKNINSNVRYNGSEIKIQMK